MQYPVKSGTDLSLVKKKDKEKSNVSLKILNVVSSVQFSREQIPALIPITFKGVPSFVNEFWKACQDTVDHGVFKDLATSTTAKDVFIKGILILCEVKVCYAQKNAIVRTPEITEIVKDHTRYSTEELQYFQEMGTYLPLPISILLHQIGNFSSDGQDVIPVMANLNKKSHLSGILTYSPRQLLPTFELLKYGVPINEEVHKMTRLLKLPQTNYEIVNVKAKNQNDTEVFKMTDESIKFWLDKKRGANIIKWSDPEKQIFVDIVNSLNIIKDFVIEVDMRSGKGEFSQIVQFDCDIWDITATYQWHTVTNIEKHHQMIAAAFGFGALPDWDIQPSRFRGNYQSAYWRGKIKPEQFVYALLNIIYKFQSENRRPIKGSQTTSNRN